MGGRLAPGWRGCCGNPAPERGARAVEAGITNRRLTGMMPGVSGIIGGKRHTAKVADTGRALPPWTLGSAHHLAARRRTP